jgi:FdhE protein
MIEASLHRLDALARDDPAVAPLARLHAAVVRAAGERGWAEGVPPFDGARLAEGVPLLHERTLTVDRARLGRLLAGLAAVAARDGNAAAERLRRALASPALDPPAVLAASLAGDTGAVAALAAGAGVDAGLLATIGQVAARPLLLACGAAAGPVVAGQAWAAGVCPVCAAWPALAELRGLDRRRWLRCGRCGAGWAFAAGRCVFCGNADHRTLGYLAPEAEREARQAATCAACHRYLKTFTVLAPLAPAEIGLQDLATLELDVAALERGYTPPGEPGFPLRVQVVAAARRAGWLGWR